MNNLFSERIGGIPWVVLAAVVAVIALVYGLLPAGAYRRRARWIILRWGHTAAWLFFAGGWVCPRARIERFRWSRSAPLAATRYEQVDPGGLIYVVHMVTVTNAA